jgi:hypothetical protein
MYTHTGEKENVHSNFNLRNMNKQEHLGDKDTDWREMLK